MQPKEEFMRAAIEQAHKGRETDNYPIGAVVVKDGKIIARSHNRTRSDQDPTQHAEVAVIREAAKALKSKYLNGCVLYTTHEPCPMCAAAIVWSHLTDVVIGATMEDMKEFRSQNPNNKWKWETLPIHAKDIFSMVKPPVNATQEFMRDECVKLFNQ